MNIHIKSVLCSWKAMGNVYEIKYPCESLIWILEKMNFRKDVGNISSNKSFITKPDRK